MIYLDHAATTPLRKEALEAMMPFFMEKAANASALYAAGRQARGAIDTARRQVAQAVGAHEGEIYFTAGAMERSHVIRAMGVPEGADVRFSLGTENTQEDIRKTVDALCRILN